MSKHGKIKLLTGTTHPELAKRVANELGIKLVETDIGHFDDGELFARVIGNVRECDVFFLASLHAHHGADSIFETQLLLDCVHESAERVTGILTWTGYAKQDRAKPREALSFRVIARNISNCGFKRVVLFDIHDLSSACAFTIPNSHVYFMGLLIEEFKQRKLNNVVIVSPDIGSGKRADTVARLTNQPDVCVVWKVHDPETKKIDVTKSKVLGDVKGKDVWIFDDMIQSFGTLEIATEIIKKAGARKITIAAVHPDFTPTTKDSLSAIDRITTSQADEVIVVDTIPTRDDAKWPSKITVIDPAPFIAKCIKLIHTGGRLSPLFLQY